MARPGREIRRFALMRRLLMACAAMARRCGWTVDGEPVLDFARMQLTGLHNAANALAALALCEAIGLLAHGLLAALTASRGWRTGWSMSCTIRAWTFIDDSKGTNVGATEAALNGMTRPVVLIAGGDGKGQDFSPLAPAAGTHRPARWC